MPKTDATTPTEAPSGPVADTPLAELPDYPGSTRIEYRVDPPTDSSGRVTLARMTTKDDLETVRTFYRKVIGDQGWRPVAMTNQSMSAMWAVNKGTAVSASIDMKKDESGTLTITLKRMDQS